MESIALWVFIIALAFNFLGVFLLVVLREKQKRDQQKLHFSFEVQEFRIFRELREILGFLSFGTVFLAIVALFFNREYFYGFIVSIFLIITITVSIAYTVNKI